MPEAAFWASVPFLMVSAPFCRAQKHQERMIELFGELENDRAVPFSAHHTHICFYVYTHIHTNVATSISFFVRSQGL